MTKIYVKNASGQREPFSFHKVYSSARNVGASKKTAQEIASQIEKEIYPEIETLKIFKRVKELLKKGDLKSAAIRFNLRNGIRKLGPTGFLFEKFIGEVFKSLGYKVKINQFLPGACLKDYEIDFLAEKDGVIYIGECKYRNLSGDKVNLKDALVNSARFQDIALGNYFKGKKIKSILVTNEKFTSSAKNYSECKGIDLLGWKYPKEMGLERIIEEKKLFPVTILPSLSNRLKEALVLERIMLTKDILKIDPLLFSKKFKINQKDITTTLNEAKLLHK